LVTADFLNQKFKKQKVCHSRYTQKPPIEGFETTSRKISNFAANSVKTALEKNGAVFVKTK
jgi:hypothetical protein